MTDFCGLVRGCVESALPVLRELRGHRRLKPDGSWVTEGDLYVQEQVAGLLAGCGEDVVLVSEESVPDLVRAASAEYVLTLDPVDGTANYTYGMADWGVLVSVYRNMKHWQSMILLPEMGRCLVSGNLPARETGSRICGLSTFISAEDFAGLDRTLEYRMIGSCAVNFYNMVTGAYCQMRHYKGAYSWDIMAGLNLCLEQGLKAYVDGEPYDGRWLAPGIRYKYSVVQE